MKSAFLEYFRCPEKFANLRLCGPLHEKAEYFPLDGIACYGRRAIETSPIQACSSKTGISYLSFDPDEIADNCRFERYLESNGKAPKGGVGSVLIKKAYYAVRPLLPVAFRKHLQRHALRDWDQISFPRWPVDLTVDVMMQQVLRQILLSSGVDRLPFIWFWPEGYQSCLMMTHDVEARPGQKFCSQLLQIDKSFGIKSSFQIVPEKRYPVSLDFLRSITDQGYEVNVHGLDHDGNLFEDFEGYRERVALINQYGRKFGACGFRSPVMYRNADWMRELEFDYDMSFPNVAHLDPQRGGCATIMPYFLWHMVELPLTTSQDYTIFHILRHNSIDLWKQQTATILENNGLLSFIIHPDYIIEKKYQNLYLALLEHLRSLIDQKRILCLLPRDLSDWWRKRSRMRLIRNGDQWAIDGEGKEYARIAYASLRANKIVYEMDQVQLKQEEVGACRSIQSIP